MPCSVLLRLSGLRSSLLGRVALIWRASRILCIRVLLHGRLIALRRKPTCRVLIALIRLILVLPVIRRLSAIGICISHRPLLAIRHGHAIIPLSHTKDDERNDKREEDG